MQNNFPFPETLHLVQFHGGNSSIVYQEDFPAQSEIGMFERYYPIFLSGNYARPLRLALARGIPRSRMTGRLEVLMRLLLVIRAARRLR